MRLFRFRSGGTITLLCWLVIVLAAGPACGDERATTSAPISSANRATPIPTPVPSPTPVPTPVALASPMYIENSLPVGCHATPAVDGAIVQEHAPGSVLTVDQVLRRGDGTWHREVEQQCWVRTTPGPVRTHTSLDAARDTAAFVRPQPVAGRTLVVNSSPVGCHQEPNAAARIVVNHPPGTLQMMSEYFRAPDGTWQREEVRGCWVRTQPGPVRNFTDQRQAEIYAAGLRPPRRLANGTFLAGGPRGGLGELTIKNDPTLDAVAVLTTSQDVTVMAVYIQAGQSVTLTGIPDGSYALWFKLGQDWDGAKEHFFLRPSQSRFEDALVFETISTARGRSYSVFEVTLFGVLGGTAETERVNPEEFPPLR